MDNETKLKENLAAMLDMVKPETYRITGSEALRFRAHGIDAATALQELVGEDDKEIEETLYEDIVLSVNPYMRKMVLAGMLMGMMEMLRGSRE